MERGSASMRLRVASMAAFITAIASSLGGNRAESWRYRSDAHQRRHFSKTIAWSSRSKYMPHYGELAARRNRMGGNATRILAAREGQVWDDGAGKYVNSPRVLPEEVEARHKEVWQPARGHAPIRKWGKVPSFQHAGVFGPDTWYETEIRGKRVRIYPRSCGPIQFVEVA